MKQRTVLAMVLAIAVGAAVGVTARQAPDATKTPTLTDAQKLQVTQLENQALTAAVKQRDAKIAFDQATQELAATQGQVQALVRKLQQDGYELDLQTLTYTKKPAAPAVKDGR